MRKGQRVSSSSESEKSQQRWSKDFSDQSSPHGCSSAEGLTSNCDVEKKNVMKKSQRFSHSFTFEEDQQLQSNDEDREEQLLPNNHTGVPVTELVEAERAADCMRLRRHDNFSGTSEPSRSGLFRPQVLWLAMMRCLSLRWPDLSINRQSNGKLAYQVDDDQLEDAGSSVTCDSSNESSSSTSTSDERETTLVKEEDVRSRGVKSVPPPRRGVSRSSPRLPRARQATDSVLASMILEKEMFLWIELVDVSDERDDLRYRAEWKLSERTKELAEGVWLSRSSKILY
ncbi:hypothetical protein Q5P01_018342 [Channa striata]|uniref:Uncharacterized protein n=1 Tax=Channa striata TaxID=64152 RepID=A0AA88M529_CHASR|nr:hypothetical protein Q5P01_018342 [Channa striata]